MIKNLSNNYEKLFNKVYDLYHLSENQSKLLFHGWHHIKFVHDKAIEFAKELNANIEHVASASLLHDLNYIFSDKLEPEAAREQIKQFLLDCDYIEDVQIQINTLIEDSHLAYRGERDISNESKALADADTLFKALPTTPILFASKFITQNKYDIRKLANKIIEEQKPLMDKGTYFYTKSATEKYLKWAKVNLTMWENVLESLEDSDIDAMLKSAKDLGVL